MDKKEYVEIANKLNLSLEKHRSFEFYDSARGKLPLLDEYKIHSKSAGFCFEKVDYSLEDMMDYALNFYHSICLDGKIKRAFEDLKPIYRFGEPSEKQGRNAVVVRGKQIEIDLNPSNDSNGLVIVAHEFGHLLEERIQKAIPQKTDCITEIVPSFCEKLYSKWLLDNKVIGKKDFEMMENKRKQFLDSNICFLLEENDILSALQKPVTAEQLENLDRKFAETKDYAKLKHRVEIMCDQNSNWWRRVVRYVVAEIVATALYKDFEKNPNETMSRFKNFLENNAHLGLGESCNVLLGDNYFAKCFPDHSKKIQDKTK